MTQISSTGAVSEAELLPPYGFEVSAEQLAENRSAPTYKSELSPTDLELKDLLLSILVLTPEQLAEVEPQLDRVLLKERKDSVDNWAQLYDLRFLTDYLPEHAPLALGEPLTTEPQIEWSDVVAWSEGREALYDVAAAIPAHTTGWRFTEESETV